MNAVVKQDSQAIKLEQVLVGGDLSKLTVEERGQYYNAVCTSVGLNPLTKPFEYIVLNGKMRLYALKDCTDQLRSIHGISVTEIIESEREGVFIVKAKVANAQGRTDVSTGAVNIAGLRGEAMANALMKAETKAKRRATLSICGLGMLDETEVEDLPAAQRAPVPSATVTTVKPAEQTVETETGPHKITGGSYAEWTDNYIAAVQTAGDAATVYGWVDANTTQIEKLAKGSPTCAARARAETDKHLNFLRKTEPKADQITSGPQGEVQSDMGTTEPPKAEKPAKGRAKASKAPDMAKDYDAWLAWQLKLISAAETPDRIEEIFEALDGVWQDLFPSDRETLMGARREAEGRLEQ
jgi:hypothetical protein